MLNYRDEIALPAPARGWLPSRVPAAEPPGNLEDGDELGRQRDCLAAPLRDLPEDQAAAPPLRARRGMCSAAGRAQPWSTGTDAYMRPA